MRVEAPRSLSLTFYRYLKMKTSTKKLLVSLCMLASTGGAFAQTGAGGGGAGGNSGNGVGAKGADVGGLGGTMTQPGISAGGSNGGYGRRQRAGKRHGSFATPAGWQRHESIGAR